MYPVLFHIGSFSVRSYSVSIAFAVMLALFVAERLARRQGYTWAGQVVDFGFSALVAGIVGARLWEVTFSFGYYRNNLLEIFQPWHGGMSIQGGIVGPVRFVRYPDEFHGMSRGGKPWHRLHRLDEITAWFAQHLPPIT